LLETLFIVTACDTGTGGGGNGDDNNGTTNSLSGTIKDKGLKME
jgi:hypothetical protein